MFAQYWVGKNPNKIGSTYAVSNDGIGKIEVMGATLADRVGDEKVEGEASSEEFVIYASSTPSTATSTAALRPKLKSRPHARQP